VRDDKGCEQERVSERVVVGLVGEGLCRECLEGIRNEISTR
jgi:hypothetical protein